MVLSSVLKINFPIVFGLLLFMGGSFHSHGQYGFNQQLDLMKTVYSWNMTQNWDPEALSWGDTSLISCVTFNTEGKPVEMISKQADKNGVINNASKSVVTYENGRVKTVNSYSWIADSNKFSKIITTASAYSYSGENITRIEASSQPFVGYTAYNSAYAPMENVKLVMDMGIGYENSKVICDSVKVKVENCSAEAKALILAMIPKFIYDTSWTDVSKGVYSYNGNICVLTKYKYNTDSLKFVKSGKDSAIFQNETIQTLYTFKQNTTGEYTVLSSKDEYTYDNTNTTQIITMNLNDKEWVNTKRVLFFYTPYSELNIKSKNFVHKINGISAVLSVIRGAHTLNLTLDKPSTVSVSIIDLKGRIAEKITPQSRYSAGSHSINLVLTSPGKYLCDIHTESSNMVVPFTVVR